MLDVREVVARVVGEEFTASWFMVHSATYDKWVVVDGSLSGLVDFITDEVDLAVDADDYETVDEYENTVEYEANYICGWFSGYTMDDIADVFKNANADEEDWVDLYGVTAHRLDLLKAWDETAYRTLIIEFSDNLARD